MSTYEEALRLRKEGYGYVAISKQIGTPWPTIRNWVQHIKIDWYTAYRRGVDMKLKPIELLGHKQQVSLRLIRKRGRTCEGCSLTEWLGKPITLEVEHLDGNKQNNKEENLKLLCPNCHSYTPTWRRSKTRGCGATVDAVV